MGTGYTRNDTSNNIANGNVIDADDIDGEFNAIESAFNASTGHTHDGTSSEGAPIEVTGPNQEYLSDATALYPKTDDTYDLGKTGAEWKDLYIDGTANIDTLTAGAGTVGGSNITTTDNTQVLTNKTLTSPNINGVVVTATGAELNILDGATVTTAELNILDGVTSTSSELNILDGATVTTAELNLLDGATVTTAELNYNDITTLGTSEASKTVTADANGNIKLSEEVQATAYLETVVALSGTTPTVDCDEANTFTLTTSGNTTFTFDYSGVNLTTDDSYGFTLKVTAGGTHTLSWPASVDWPGGEAPEAPASGETDVFVFFTTDGGTTWYGFQAGDALA